MDNPLELPYVATIPYAVQIDDSISDAAKIYYGQIVSLAKKSGYIWATDEQLAQMKGTSKRTIERWNKELEDAGHIQRVTQNVPSKQEDGDFAWTKKRKIYINDGFSLKPKYFEKLKELETAKNGGTIETAKNGGTIETAKNGGINNTSLDDISKLQPVVVSSYLEKLDIPDKLKVSIIQNYAIEDIQIAVERCIRWKSRPNDVIGIQTTLSRPHSWSDKPTGEEQLELNRQYLEKIQSTDGTMLGNTKVIVGNTYIEFVSGPKSVTFTINDPDFKKDVINYVEKLKSYMGDDD